VTATARKIAVLSYDALRFGTTHNDPGAADYEERDRAHLLANPKRRAKLLGFELAPIPPPWLFLWNA
jgi:transposase